MNATIRLSGALVFAAAVSLLAAGGDVAKIQSVEGTLSVLRGNGDKWINGRPGMPLGVGDQVYTRAESFAEIAYVSGAVLRMRESTKIVIESSTDKGTKTRSGVGEVWVNMRKLVNTQGKEFELSTPTATAAIRGTVFDAATHADSSTDVSVYRGTVAVGPGDSIQKKAPEKSAPAVSTPAEVPGPEEVPGPYEVTLEEWKNIVAGQRISVRKDGKFAQEPFDAQKEAARDAFVKKNIALDKKLGQ